MSEKTIELVINTSRGEKNLKQIERLAQRVEKSLGKINKIKINVKTDQAQKKLSALTKEINKGNRKIDTFFKGANPGMTVFGNKISKVRDELSSVRKAFDDASSAVERQRGATALLAGNFKKLRMEAVAFAKASGADPSLTIGSVSARIKEIQQFPRTILAGNEAMSLLKRMQEMTIVGSKEFLEVSKAIGVQLGINANIQSQAARAAKPMQANQVFATSEQIQALGGKNRLIPPSMRLPAAGKSSGTFEIKSRPIEKSVKNIQKTSAKTANLLAQQTVSAGFTGATTGGFGVTGGQIGPAQLTRFEKAGFGKKGQAGGLFAFPGGKSARIKGGIGSALIGGGFPALFGAGGLSSILGGIAGGAGGALAPGGGFAASIFATAIAGQIEDAIQFRKAVKSLNKELAASGAITKISRKEIKELAKSLDISKEKAIEVVIEFQKFADTGILDLSDTFKTRALFDATVGADDFQSTLSRIQTLSEDLTLGTEFKAYKILAEQGSEAANKFIKDQIFLRRETEKFNDLIEGNFKMVEVQTFIRDFQRFGVGQSNIPGLRNFESLSAFSKEFNTLLNEVVKENKEIQQILNDPKNQILIKGTSKTILSSEAQQRINNILKPLLKDSESVLNLIKKFPEAFNLTTTKSRELTDALSKLPEALEFLQEFRAPDEELKKMLNPLRQILDLSVAIRDGFEESFKGIIKGTMTVSDAFRNMLNRIADHFLDSAARIAARQIQKGFLGFFENMFTSPVNDIQNKINTAANGGPIGIRQPTLVGERGPELFVPNQSGNIIPNHDLAGIGGGGTNIVVNVDASGSSVEGDEQGGRELGLVLSAAIESELIKQKRPGGLLA